MSSFAEDIIRFANNTKKTLEKTSRAITINLFNGIIRDTRVATGRLRGNWQTSIGQPKYEEINRLDKTGQLATTEVRNIVIPLGVNYLTNNLPYAEPREEKDGMVKKNIARIERTIKELI